FRERNRSVAVDSRVLDVPEVCMGDRALAQVPRNESQTPGLLDEFECSIEGDERSLPVRRQRVDARETPQREDLRRLAAFARPLEEMLNSPTDRKSTRLNSSHLGISYAVFCLKK